MIRASILLMGGLFLACRSKTSPGVEGSGGANPNGPNFCDLPGSVRFTSAGRTIAAGADVSKISLLKLPEGYCAHYFGNVGNPRQLRFAPGGELFVASPTKGTTGGGVNGKSAIVVMPDDDRDRCCSDSIVFPY
ncbi:MAG: hypothetical protein QM756_29100 [Polyangiaceae bacterium]